MRINQYIAASTGLSRRASDALIADARVSVNGQPAQPGMIIAATDTVTLDKTLLTLQAARTILLHKPPGYVTSREGQGSPTVYDLLPPELHNLKPVGRLDKDSSGLLLLTNDGQRAQQLTHPSYQKTKEYEVELDQPLQPLHRQMISDIGLSLDDGLSKLQLARLKEGDEKSWIITMTEGRNRQIRRTFAALGYHVTKLHRTRFGTYDLANTLPGTYRDISLTKDG